MCCMKQGRGTPAMIQQSFQNTWGSAEPHLESISPEKDCTDTLLYARCLKIWVQWGLEKGQRPKEGTIRSGLLC